MNSFPIRYKQKVCIYLLKKGLLNLYNKDYIRGIAISYLQSAGESVVKLVLADHNSHSL